MHEKTREDPKISKFILENLEEHPRDIVALAVKEFSITRAAIGRYLQRLIERNIIKANGHTKARRYFISDIISEAFSIKLSEGLPEDLVWRHRVLPLIKDVKQNIMDICSYGFTEMFNNAIDHSASFEAIVSFRQNYNEIEIAVIDEGIGIFEKIKTERNLADPRTALLELSKGKLTTYPAKHAGEGIFFTSRMFDKFSIRSGNLYYSRTRKDDDEWLLEARDEKEYTKGTAILMNISTDAEWTTREVFNQYQNDRVGFRKTHVPIKLAKYPGELLVSRSQAKRILARFDNFSEVLLDFEGVTTIGQAFADEIFRVFKIGHPDIDILAVNITEDIKKMIAHVKASAPLLENQLELFRK